MKILALIGSGRANGNTARVLSLIEERLRHEANLVSETLDFEKLNLGSSNIQMCQGCRVCFDRGEGLCPLKDGLLTIKSKMKQADGIVVATPVYVNDVSGITKNWIDRLAHVCHRPEFAGKCAYLLATVADGPTSHALTTLNMALRTWGVHLVGQAGLKTGSLMDRDEIMSRHQNKINQIANRLFHAIYRRQFTQPSFFSLMTFHIQQLSWQKHTDDTIDYQYWKNKGWLNTDRSFYIPHNTNPVKVGLAKVAGALIAPFVS